AGISCATASPRRAEGPAHQPVRRAPVRLGRQRDRGEARGRRHAALDGRGAGAAAGLRRRRRARGEHHPRRPVRPLRAPALERHAEDARAVARPRPPPLQRRARPGGRGLGDQVRRDRALRPAPRLRGGPLARRRAHRGRRRRDGEARLGTALPRRRLQPPAGESDRSGRLLLARGRGAGTAHVGAFPARRLGDHPQPPRRLALAPGAAGDPRARERLPRARGAVHARRGLRAGSLRRRGASELQPRCGGLPGAGALRMNPGMKPLRIDFCRTRRGPRWVSPVLLAIAVAFAADVAYTGIEALHEVRAAEHALAKLDPRSYRPARQVTPEEIAEARETLARLSTPWDELFLALEQASSREVALLAVEPDPKSGKVVISGDSKDYLAALTYVLNL